MGGDCVYLDQSCLVLSINLTRKQCPYGAQWRVMVRVLVRVLVRGLVLVFIPGTHKIQYAV